MTAVALGTKILVLLIVSRSDQFYHFQTMKVTVNEVNNDKTKVPGEFNHKWQFRFTITIFKHVFEKCFYYWAQRCKLITPNRNSTL